MKTIPPAAVLRAYERVGRAVRQLALAFARRTRTDADDVLSDAQFLFLTALYEYDPARYTLLRWVRLYVRRRLSDLHRPQMRRRALRRELDFRLVPESPRPLSDLGADADFVVRTTVRRSLRSAKRLRQLLLARGWSAGRIDRTFDEIRESL